MLQGGLALSQLALQLPGRWVLQSAALQQSLPWAEALVFGWVWPAFQISLAA